MRKLLRSARVRLLIGVAIVVVLAVWLFVPLVRREQMATSIHATETQSAEATQTAQRAARALHVVGNKLVTRAGQSVLLHGVNRGGTDYLCAEGKGIFDGPTGPASIAAIQSWHINAVRVPLNEECWLGASSIRAEYSKAAYQDAIASYVLALTNRGIYVILDLHKNAPGSNVDTHTFQPMPDADHSVIFWQQVAARFKDNGMVLFDLFNEPHPHNWKCWLHGGTCEKIPYVTAGMQQLLDSVRGVGASNVVLLGGLNYASDVRGLLANLPADPLHNLAADMHAYMTLLPCTTVTCYDQRLGPVAANLPLVVGEFGTDNYGKVCGIKGADVLLNWLDQHTASYLAWSWNVGSQTCGSLALISDWEGTPKAPNGTFFKSHLAALP